MKYQQYTVGVGVTWKPAQQIVFVDTYWMCLYMMENKTYDQDKITTVQ